jgi:hypothetical protein
MKKKKGRKRCFEKDRLGIESQFLLLLAVCLLLIVQHDSRAPGGLVRTSDSGSSKSQNF